MNYVEKLDQITKEALIESEQEHFERNQKIESIINLQNSMMNQCSLAMYMTGTKLMNYREIAILTINKNIDYLYAAYILTRRGIYGAARPLFRNVYESLVILKTISITNNQILLDDWNEGKNLNLTRTIFKNVVSPITEEMPFFWNELCKYSHGSIYSSNQNIKYCKKNKDIIYNYSMIEILLYLNYHVLNRYLFTNSMKQFVDRNCLYDEELCKIPLERDILRDEMKLIRKKSSKHARKLITEFCKVWKFKKI